MSSGLPVSSTGDGNDVTGEYFMDRFPNMTSEEPAFLPKFEESTTYRDFYDAVY